MSLNQYMDPEDNDGDDVGVGVSSSARTPLLQDDDDIDGDGAHPSWLPRPQRDRSSSSSLIGGSLGFARGAGHEDGDGPGGRRWCRRRIPTLAIIVATGINRSRSHRCDRMFAIIIAIDQIVRDHRRGRIAGSRDLRRRRTCTSEQLSSQPNFWFVIIFAIEVIVREHHRDRT